DGMRLAVHRQVAGDAIVAADGMLDPRRGELDGRMVLDVEEVRGAKMLVAPRLGCVDRRRLDRAPNRRVVVVGSRLDRPLERAEMAADSRDHHVLDPELDGRMRPVHGPCPGRTRTMPRSVSSCVAMSAPLLACRSGL